MPFPDRKSDEKRRALPFGTRDGNGSFMELNDFRGNSQPQACPRSQAFGGEKWFENSFGGVCGNSDSGVLNGQANVRLRSGGVRFWFGLYSKHSSMWHGVDGIVNDVVDGFLKVEGITLNERQIRGKGHGQLNAMILKQWPEEENTLIQQLGQGDWFKGEGRGASKGEKVPDAEVQPVSLFQHGSDAIQHLRR